MTDPVVAPSTIDLVAALAAGLLPLAGNQGIAAASLIPAVEALYNTVSTHSEMTFTVADLTRIILGDNAAAMSKLAADIAAMPDTKSPPLQGADPAAPVTA